MTQEVEITLTLEVDVTFNKDDIKHIIETAIDNGSNYLKFIEFKSIKEEAELYKND